MLILAAIPLWLTGLFSVLFLLLCLVLIVTILVQKPMGGGLVGALGGGGGSGQTAFGAKTGDMLTIFTIVVFSLFVLGAIGLNFAFRPAEVEAAAPELIGADPSTPATTPTPAVPTPGPTQENQTSPVPADPSGSAPEPGDEAAGQDVGSDEGGDEESPTPAPATPPAEDAQ